MAYSFAVAEEVFAHRGGDRAEAPSLRAMRALAWAVDAKDPYTHRHSARVADLAVQIATALGLARDAAPPSCARRASSTTSARSPCRTRSCSSPAR